MSLGEHREPVEHVRGRDDAAERAQLGFANLSAKGLFSGGYDFPDITVVMGHDTNGGRETTVAVDP